MVWLWIVNALLCFMFFALSINAWRQRAHTFAILNMIGGLLMAGFEALDLLGQASTSGILLVAVPLGLIFSADVVLVLGDLLSRTSRPVPAHPPVNFAIPAYFLTVDETRMRDELSRQQGLREQDRARALRLWKLGNAAFARAHYEAAQQRYEQAAALSSGSSCFSNLAAALLAQKQFAAAMVKGDLALAQDAANYEAWLNRGVALFMVEQFPEAIHCFDRGASVQPASDVPHLCKAHALRRLGRWLAATEACDVALQMDARKGEAWHLKALCLNRLGRFSEAQSCFEKAIALRPGDYEAHVHLGNLLLKGGRYVEAVESYEQALRLRPDCLEALNNRGIALGKAGNLSDALRSYEQALQVDGNYYEAWLNLGIAHDVRNETRQALDSYRKFLQLAPTRMHKHISAIRQRADELSRQDGRGEEAMPSSYQPARQRASVK